MASASGFKSSLTGSKANRWLSDLTEKLGGNFAEFASHIGFTESQVKVIQETGQHLHQLVISKWLDTIGRHTTKYQHVVYTALVTLKRQDLLDRHFKGGTPEKYSDNIWEDFIKELHAIDFNNEESRKPGQDKKPDVTKKKKKNSNRIRKKSINGNEQKENVIEKDSKTLLLEDDTTLSGNLQIEPSAGNRYDTKVLGCRKWTLFQAARCGDIRLLENCIEDKIDFGSKSTDGRTVLHIAVANMQYKFVQYLLDVYRLLQKAGFYTGITTNDGKTFLDFAREKHHTHYLDLIGMTQYIEVKRNRYDTKVRGCSKWTLIQAAKCGDIRLLENGIEDKINVGSKCTDEITVLHIAVANMQYEFVLYLSEVNRLLQKAGFYTGITTNDRKTFLDLAKEKHHNQHLDLIGMTQNIEVKGIHWSTWTKLHHCAVSGSEAECSRLIEDFPKDVNVEVDTDIHPYTNLQLPKYGKMTPLELAMHSENIPVLNILAKYSSFRTIDKCLAGVRTISTKTILVRGILTQLLEKHEDVQYGKLIATGENVIVIYTTDQLDDACSKIAGIQTIYKNANGFDQDNERAIDFELDMEVPGLSKEENERMKDVVDANSDTLWRNHENLNGIRISAVRTTGGKAFRDNCIVLCCKFKGFLTEKEEEFPRVLRCKDICFPVDVREEYIVLTSQPSDKLKPLACGGIITGSCVDNKVCGTIGPFVELPNQKTGFITCAHVLDNNPAFGVQSGRNHIVYQPQKDSNADSLCGEVVKMTFKPSADPSIDAAVVKITSALRIPRSINFVSVQQGAFLDAGIAEGLTFNTGTIGDYLPDSPVLKFGAFTSELNCVCSAIGHEEKIVYPQGKVLMRGLTRILCRVIHQQGDSGGGVFVKNAEDKLECVGLFFAAKGREGYFIPIKDVLTQCGGYKLKAYP
ncbi:uncharacterized protein LOC110454394 [Mizuhopecten yessoensis]|uniref:uncharacterized protein LOC110454394 n=1 Tax=Mizuhopecten yessoensis TaxID=6573 RepID=UPI000B458233|nr:uncharacterized protein LOC110454394 [Mizuhopecten yessoensis]